MSAKTIFRGLLVAAAVSIAASIGAYFLQRDSLPLDLREYLQSRSQQVLSQDYTMVRLIAVALTVPFIVSFVGLYFFWRPARLFFCAFVLVELLTPLADFGPNIETGWMELWGSCSNILLGVILCLMFTSPVREQFAIRRTVPDNGTAIGGV